MEDAADARKELGEARAVILSLQGMIIESNADKNQLEKENEDKQKLTELASKAKMDFKDIVNLLQNRIFNTNSDRTRYLNGAIDLNAPLISEMGFEAIIQEVLRQTDEIIGQEGGNADKENKERPKYQKKPKKNRVGKSKKHHVFTKEILQRLGMDTSNLPEGSKEPIVRKLFKLLHQMKANIDDYGSLMRRAINYMLDDEKGFKAFLTDGAITYKPGKINPN